MTPKAFFEKYSNFAVESHGKSGVPASIVLAQSALESGWATSDLTTNYNNFFGIQCHRWRGWIGQCVPKTDYDSEGKPYKTEFRVYASPYDSFIDHANFLMDNPRYNSLFENTDYKSWAYGLENAGYAEDKNYAENLISIIESNNLTVYDREGDIQMKGIVNTIIRNRKRLYIISGVIAFLLVVLYVSGRKIFK